MMDDYLIEGSMAQKYQQITDIIAVYKEQGTNKFK